GAVRQVVGGDRHQHPALDLVVQDGSAGRERVGGRAGGRADDEAIGPQVGDELRADLDAQLDHAGGGAAAHDHVVHGMAVEDDLAVAVHLAFEHGARVFLV